MTITLAQIALPEISNVFQFILLAIGGLVFLFGLYSFIKSKGDISPYSGMPALITILLFIFLVGIGAVIDMSMWPSAIATIVAFIVEVASSVFLWPFFILVLIAQGYRAVQVILNGLKGIRN